MRHQFIGNSLDRESMVELVGEENLVKLEKANCDFSNRVMDDDDVEFTASIDCVGTEGIKCRITAYYYQDQSDVSECDDLGSLDWEVDDYSFDYLER
jgi:hypothetical protein